METGHVLEFIDRQRIMCAVVLEVKKERLRVLTENNREVKITPARLAHRSTVRLDPTSSRLRLVEAMRTIAERRRALSDHIDVKTLWEVLNEDPMWIDLATMAGLCFPQGADADQSAAVARALFDNRLYFRFDQNRFLPVAREQVEQRLSQEAEAARRQRVVNAGAEWLARVAKTDDPPPAPAVESAVDLPTMLLDYVLYGRDSVHMPLVREMLGRTGGSDVDGLFALLVKCGLVDPEENLDLRRWQIPQHFDTTAMAEAAAVKARVAVGTEFNGREDLTGLKLLTIDGQSTLDFDDALSLERLPDGWRLGIHIADVAHRVPKDGPLDLAARQRGSSIYMPDQRISMLPAQLAEDCCSLIADTLRPAISLLVTLDSALAVRQRRIVPSLVRVAEQLTYHDANLLVEQRPDLAQLQRIAARFRAQRVDGGALQINVPEVSIRVNGSGEIFIHRLNRESPARLIVSEMMILANWLMACSLVEWALPAVFRGQPAPRQRLCSGDAGTLFQHHMQRKQLSRLVLDRQAQPHAGLGLNAYVTATSPIRKYFDLVTQRQLRAGLGLEAPYSAEAIDKVLQALEQPLSQVALLQRNRHRYWLLRHLEGRIGGKEEAIVLQRRRAGCLVLIPEYMIECELPLSGGMSLHPEDLVQVTIQHVDARRDIFSIFLG